MSITYSLELRTDLTPDAVLAVLVGAPAVVEHEKMQGSLRGGGWFSVDFAEYDPPDAVELAFGFVPTVEVYFGLDKFRDFDAQETDVLGLGLAILERCPGDALLHRQHEDVWLLRRDNRLTINPALWKPHQLALVSDPHTPAALTFG